MLELILSNMNERTTSEQAFQGHSFSFVDDFHHTFYPSCSNALSRGGIRVWQSYAVTAYIMIHPSIYCEYVNTQVWGF